MRLAEAAEALQANRDKAALVGECCCDWFIHAVHSAGTTPTNSRFSQFIPLGLAADVVYLEQQLAALPGVPLEPIRENLDRHGVVLPPRVLATVATATSGAGQR